MNGAIADTGTIIGGLAIDSTSKITSGTPAIKITGPTFTGGIANAGTISAGNFGVNITNVAQSGSGGSGGITNSGTISAAQFGISASNVSTFSGGIVNTGTISAGSAGIYVSNLTAFSGNISNAGVITAKTGIVIGIGNGVTFVSGSAIVNSGTITGTGGTAIDVRGASNAVTIDQNARSIIGNILLSSNADTLNVAGGTISGNVIGSGSSDTINIAPVGTFTDASPYGFSNINQVNVNSGSVVLNGVNSATNLTVAGGTLAGTGMVNGAVTIASGGTLQPGVPGSVGNFTVAGNLTLASGANYADTIDGASASQTNVSGTATLGGATVTIPLGSLVNPNTTYTILNDTGSSVVGTFNPTVKYEGMTGTLSHAGGVVDLTSRNSACFTGPFPHTNSVGHTIACILVQNTSFSGNVSNAGTISPSGIFVNHATIAGSIVNSGNLAGGISIDSTSRISSANTAIKITGPTFSGELTNAGAISTTGNDRPGIFIGGVTNFSGSIVNGTSGTISAAAAGGMIVANVSTFAGAISNAGVISVSPLGILVGISGSGIAPVVDFTGGIANSGTISAGEGGIDLSNVSTFAGGIFNFGTIAAITKPGIVVGGTTTAQPVSIFTGGITNTGTISSARDGVLIDYVSTFTGGISNSGTISAGIEGVIVVNVSTFSNGIYNSGLISAGFLDAAIAITNVSSFGAGISNTGTE